MGRPANYFPGLYGLRFLAVFVIFLANVEHMKANWGMPSINMHPVVWNMSSTFFTAIFVISGFLITYLLLKEKQQTGKISIRKFYMRRFLSIWPLYILVVLLSFFVFPNIEALKIPYISELVPENFSHSLLLFLLLLPQVANSVLTPVPFAISTGPVGALMQFYILWPLVVKYSKKLIRVLLLLIAVIFILKLLASVALEFYADHEFTKTLTLIRKILESIQLDCFAVGALAGYILFAQKKKWLTIIYHPITWVTALVSLGVLIITGFNSPFVKQTIYAVLLAVVILNMASNSKLWLRLENAIFRYLGKISLGFFLFHGIAIQLGIYYLQDFYYNPFSLWYENVILYAVSFAGTILVATAWYYTFEQLFIWLKKRYAVVKDADQL